jgi:hypothetical protein
MHVACFLLGVSLTLLARYEIAVYRATRLPPSKKDVTNLLTALATWAEKFNMAKPTRAKERERDLFDACTKVGLMWLRPKSPLEEKT